MPISYKLRGSLQYSSPETVVDKGLQQEPPSDVWALGLIVFEMLTGKSVWDGKQDSEVEDILSEIGEGHGVLKLPAQMLLDLSFVAGLGKDSGEDEEELSVEDSEEKDCSPSLSYYETDDELSSYAFPDYWNFRVIKKPNVDGVAARVCLSSSYDAVDDAGLSSFFSDRWSNMPLEAEELEEIAEPGSVYLTLSVHY
ncbi:uncharacterized protein LOC114296535 [Camellia sinensis]|uniref:uncharacterized protein LOC114296535 n=1 Tax=Camellia sinensis TaxID=4442 RepID=UPI00103654B7|nr:uncharacterized protein LOC114296535 [Camellia sinensis]